MEEANRAPASPCSNPRTESGDGILISVFFFPFSALPVVVEGGWRVTLTQFYHGGSHYHSDHFSLTHTVNCRPAAGLFTHSQSRRQQRKLNRGTAAMPFEISAVRINNKISFSTYYTEALGDNTPSDWPVNISVLWKSDIFNNFMSLNLIFPSHLH